jgi:hypothetical protein
MYQQQAPNEYPVQYANTQPVVYQDSYQQQPMYQQQTTTVIVPTASLGHEPTVVTCANCKQAVTTNVTKVCN